ncbi:uncharacterized protein [Diadema antillarum]|uniref:uncharacterized protein n=1 Tax=Diadema antillarum TaxID=105358 RepID=UPI003A8C81BC
MASRLLIIFSVLAGIACSQEQNCNFDDPLTEDPKCGWSNYVYDDFDWSLRRRATPSRFTGPSGDHTTGSGNFLYTEAEGRSPGDKAWLFSPDDSPADSDESVTLISFWYSMWENFPLVDRRSNMGTLNVYIEYNGYLPTTQPFWSRSGSQTDQGEWKEGRILFRAPAPFRVIFEGVIGDGDRSDIGIDDVSVRQTEFETFCDFESHLLGDLCMFYQEEVNDDFDWSRHSGETPSLDTGPLNDHTYRNETGHYLYIETTRPGGNASAQLISYPFFKHEGDDCSLHFYYHAFGQNVGTLRVSFVGETSTDTHVVIDGQSSDSWNETILPVSFSSGFYTIVIEGTRGGGNLGDIAIDDVSLSSDCSAIDYCLSNPCRNGASCTSSPGLGYECLCAPGWTGLHCDEDIPDCTPEACEEGFECIELVNGFDCVCPEGYQGDACEELIPVEPPVKPIDTEIYGVDPEMVPVIIGSCIGSFILIVTATWFTATCIRQDGFRKKKETQVDVESKDGPGSGSSAYVNTTYEPDGEEVDKRDNENYHSQPHDGGEPSSHDEGASKGAPPDVNGEGSGKAGSELDDDETGKKDPAYSEIRGEEDKKDPAYSEIREEEDKTEAKQGVESKEDGYEEVKENKDDRAGSDVQEVDKKMPDDLSTKYDEDVETQSAGDESDRQSAVVLTTSL